MIISEETIYPREAGAPVSLPPFLSVSLKSAREGESSKRERERERRAILQTIRWLLLMFAAAVAGEDPRKEGERRAELLVLSLTRRSCLCITQAAALYELLSRRHQSRGGSLMPSRHETTRSGSVRELQSGTEPTAKIVGFDV